MNIRTTYILSDIAEELKGTSLNEYVSVIGEVGQELKVAFFDEFRKYDDIRSQRMQMLQEKIDALKAENKRLKSDAPAISMASTVKIVGEAPLAWKSMYEEAAIKLSRYKVIIAQREQKIQELRETNKRLNERLQHHESHTEDDGRGL